MSTTASKLLDIFVAAERLDVSVGTLRSWIIQGTAPTYVRVGRLIKFDPKDVEAFIEARKVKCA